LDREEEMKIAVIIPYYPSGDTVDLYSRCLHSIDKRFAVYSFIDNNHEGVSVVRNKGIDAALDDKPNYITFLDADDVMEFDAYDQLVAAINEEPEEQIIQLNHRRRQPDGNLYCKFYNRRGTYDLARLPEFWVGVWNKVYKADLIWDIRFKPGLNHGEDELFNLMCLAKARRIYCSERAHMVHCFDNPQCLSKTVKVEDLLAEQRALLDFAEYHADDGELLDAVRQRQAYLWDNKVYRETFIAKPNM
jgi:glycosyltransferase involved in cell wall biosynthesis